MAVLGIAVLRFSRAGTAPTKPVSTGDNYGCPTAYGIPIQTIRFGDYNGCVSYFRGLIAGIQKVQGLSGGLIGQAQPMAGKFGASTRSWAKEFQKAKGLSQDGIVGPQTWSALIKACYVDIQCASPQRGGGPADPFLRP